MNSSTVEEAILGAILHKRHVATITEGREPWEIRCDDDDDEGCGVRTGSRPGNGTIQARSAVTIAIHS